MADTFRVDPKKLAPYTSSAFSDTLGRLFTSGIFMGELNSFDIDNTVGGLNFKVKTGRALINGVFVELGALSDTKSMPASSTRHVYIALTQDASSPPKPTGATIEILTGTPTTPYVQIATLISGASTITSVNQTMRFIPIGFSPLDFATFSAFPSASIMPNGIKAIDKSTSEIYIANGGVWEGFPESFDLALPSSNGDGYGLGGGVFLGAEPVLCGTAGRRYKITHVKYRQGNTSHNTCIACFIVNGSPPTNTNPRLVAFAVHQGAANTNHVVPVDFSIDFEGGQYIMSAVNTPAAGGEAAQNGLPSVNRQWVETFSINPLVNRSITWVTNTFRRPSSFKYIRVRP